MAWIKTIKPDEADADLRGLYGELRAEYPIEYDSPAPGASRTDESIVETHSLIPSAMFHAFAEFAALMSPDLPLQRRQHEMIATIVSVTNRCHY